MNPKKKTATTRTIRPTEISQGAALASLMHDRKLAMEAVVDAGKELAAMNRIKEEREEAALLATGKVHLFMKEHGLNKVRCDGMLIEIVGDCLLYRDDTYTDLPL